LKYLLLHEKPERASSDTTRDTFERKMSSTSGQWYGRYWQPDGATSAMNTMLFFEFGKITGEGLDDIGLYRWFGTYSKYSHDNNFAQITLVKSYHNAHSVNYKGFLDNEGRIKGQWIIGQWSGNFVFSREFGACDLPEAHYFSPAAEPNKQKKKRQKKTSSSSSKTNDGNDQDYNYEKF